jgi:hypothetical protein
MNGMPNGKVLSCQLWELRLKVSYSTTIYYAPVGVLNHTLDNQHLQATLGDERFHSTWHRRLGIEG